MEGDSDNCLAEREQEQGIPVGSGNVLQPGQRIGAYRIIRQLGTGGMGQVYEAEYVALRTRRALKVFSTESEHVEFLRKRFIGEGRMLADRLKHPRIVRVYDLVEDEDSGLPYLGMDLVLSPSGQPRTLSDEKRDGVSEDKIVGWFKDICEGLAYIHSQGVVHRDISLDNILIGPDGRAVITDFGIAKIIDESFRKMINMTVTVVSKDGSGLLMGKGFYVAPELKKGGEETYASDAYAVGVTLYRLLMGSWYEPGAKLDCLSNFEYDWKPVISRLCNVDPEKRLGEGGIAALPSLLKRVDVDMEESSPLQADHVLQPGISDSADHEANNVPFWRRKWFVLNGIAATLFVTAFGTSCLTNDVEQSTDAILLYNELTSDEGATSNVAKSDDTDKSDKAAKPENTHGGFVRRKIVVNKAKEFKYKFEIDKSTGNQSVTVVKVRNYQGDYTIPAEIDGCKVTKIGMGAFSDCHELNSVTIPVGVTDVGGGAFSRCTGLMCVTIPASVTSIGERVFSNCRKLGVIIVASSNRYYKSSSGLLLTKDGKTLIHGVNGDVTMPDGVTRIENEAFLGCSGLANVKIPDSVTSISDEAFEGCYRLKSVTIPDKVTSIGKWSFLNCSEMTNVAIPASVTNINESAFIGCRSLKAFSVTEGNRNYKAVSGLLLTKDGKTLIRGVNGDVIIPEGVMCIKYKAFDSCSGLTSVTIPQGTTYIGDGAFSDCTGLTSVTIPGSVTNIGRHAFSDCSRLTSVTIDNGVTYIGDYAFEYCSSLTSMTIPGSVTNIGYWAFMNRTSIGKDAIAEADLKTVYVSAGDTDRVKNLFVDSGHDITDIEFIESKADDS